MVTVNLENHKGGWCPYSKQTLFCQEGMCEGCLIWQKWKEEKKK
jgi:hypothetical protein